MKWRELANVGHGYPAALAAVALTTALAFPWRPYLSAAIVTLLYVPVIIGVARFWGVRVSAAASLAAFVAIDLIFVTPYYRFAVVPASGWLGLVVFLIVALVVGQQTARLREREQAALGRQRELELLYRVASNVASEESATAVAEFVASELTSVLGATRVAIYAAFADGGGTAACLVAIGEDGDHATEEALIAWVLASNKAIGLGHPEPAARELFPASVRADQALPGVRAEGIYLPLQTSDSLEGVLHVRLPAEAPQHAGSFELLVAVASLTASSFERQRLQDEAARAEALREADRLKTTLVSSVSHELKTPLAAATARVTGLIEEAEGCDPARIGSELAAVAEDLQRLDSSIGDLLDLSRLESDAWRPVLEEHEVGDVLGTVLSRLPAGARGRIHFELSADVPAVRVDFAQLARALRNLVDNALAYSPAEMPVVIGVRRVGQSIRISVEDRGPGVPDAEKAAVFEKFYRGASSSASPGGTGLGLTIANEIVRARGGRMWVEDATPSGARFIVELPVGETPPIGTVKGT